MQVRFSLLFSTLSCWVGLCVAGALGSAILPESLPVLVVALMALSCLAFDLLSHPARLALVWEMGTFLASRREEEFWVNLYSLPGTYLVEVFYDPAANEALVAYAHPVGISLNGYAPSLSWPG